MKKLTLAAVDVPMIDINGHVFELKMSDTEIMAMVNSVRHKYVELVERSHPNEEKNDEEGQSKPTVDEIIAATQEAAACIDCILGDGAVKILSESRPVSAKIAISWLNAISAAAIEAYTEQLVKKNE